MLIDFDLSIVLMLLVIWAILVFVLRKKCKKDFVYIMFFSVFFTYICFVTKYTQFPIIIDNMMREEIGQNIFQNSNVVPLLNLTKNDIRISLLNIALTIPFGIGLPFLKKCSIKTIALWGLLFILSIETTQFIVALLAGFSMRSFDINDIIFNVIGVLIGFLSYNVFKTILKKLTEKLSIKSNKVLDFMTN